MAVLLCPFNCSRELDYKHVEKDYSSRANWRHKYYYKCFACRRAFRAEEGPNFPLQITYPTGLQIRFPSLPKPRKRTPPVGRMGCPQCGQHGRIWQKYNRHDGVWRYHRCPTHGLYYSHQDGDLVTVHKKLKSTRLHENL